MDYQMMKNEEHHLGNRLSPLTGLKIMDHGYALIEFPDRGTDIVPSNWLFEQKCYWPNYNPAKLKTAIKKKEPIQENWKLFEPVRLLKKCETLEKAQKLLKQYVDPDLHTSEITSDEEGHDKKIKRKKRPNPRFVDFTQNDSDLDMAPKKSRLPAAPIIDFTDLNVAPNQAPGQKTSDCHVNPNRVLQVMNHGANKGENHIVHQDSGYEAHQATHHGAHQDTYLEAHQDTHHEAHQDTGYRAHQETPHGTHQDTGYRAHQYTHYRAHQDTRYGAHQGTMNELVNERYINRTSTPTVPSLFSDELSPFKRSILKVLMEIKTELKEQRAILQKLQGAPSPVPNDTECSLPLPLVSLEDFDALERLLEDDVEKNRLICQLSLLGGQKLEDTVRRMLSNIFTNRLASFFNWAGRGQKRSFETSNLQKTMFRALRNTPQCKEASKQAFSEAVKKWLRYAPDREGGSGRSSSFTHSSSFKEHINIHTREKQYTCDQCGKVYLAASSLRKHLKVHTKPLDRPGTYVRILFVDFSSAFNTIIPPLLHTELNQLYVPSPICQWITSFRTVRQQLVRLGKFTSSSRTTNTGAPQATHLKDGYTSGDIRGFQAARKSPSLRFFHDDGLWQISRLRVNLLLQSAVNQ
ncbi:uncharacterized protein [Garra rufa]|uniref:uncharacterized protein n=1 Tax=Garra rufa TaxID=137080 RepID=UPI003CCEC9F6